MDSVSSDLQEQILVVLAFHDRESAVINGMVPAELFQGHYQEIAKRLLKYRSKYGEPPGSGIFSLFSDLQESEAWDVYRDTLAQMEENSDRVAPKFVLDELAGFIRRQRLKREVMEVYAELQGDDSDRKMDEVENRLLRVCQDRVSAFDLGLEFSDVATAWGSVEEDSDDVIRTGIDMIDKRHLGPRRGQISLLIAPSKTGKSWWGVHLTKTAAVTQGKSVLFVTLEISADEVMRRIHSSMLAIRRDDTPSEVAIFHKDERGRVQDIEIREGHTGLWIGEDGFYDSVEKGVDILGRKRIIVKEFPSGTLTEPMLDSYLASAQANHGFMPDLVVLDYADLMKLNSENLRIELERLFIDLRGLAQRRNFALVTMSQANRRGAESKSGVDVHHVGESWGKVAAADTIMTLSRSKEEDRRGLARLSVKASRVGQDGFTVLVSQDYASGQFVIDQAPAMDISGMVIGEDSTT